MVLTNAPASFPTGMVLEIGVPVVLACVGLFIARTIVRAIRDAVNCCPHADLNDEEQAAEVTV